MHARNSRNPLTPSEYSEIRIRDSGGGESVHPLYRAGMEVVRGATVLRSGRPVEPVVMVICRKKISLFAIGESIFRRAGSVVPVIDASVDVYIAPWATENQPLIFKGSCREIGECTAKDISERCGCCHNRRSQAAIAKHH